MNVKVIGQVEGIEYELVHISQVALLLCYSKRYTRRLCDEGKLIACKIGRDWFAYPQLIKSMPPTALPDVS